MTDRIVVGVDGSDQSRRALAYAVDEARRRDDVVVEAVMAYSWPPMYAALDPGAAPPRAAVELAARQRLAEVLAPAPPDVHVEPIVVLGSAGGALVECSAGATLVVVGSRGLGGVRSLLLGSTSHQVVSHAHCPVVVVPHASSARSGDGSEDDRDVEDAADQSPPPPAAA